MNPAVHISPRPFVKALFIKRCWISAIGYALINLQNGWACAVCFGEGNSELANGFFWGILILLLLPVIIILTIAGKIIRSSRKKELLSITPHKC